MKPTYISSISEPDNLAGLAQKERKDMEAVTHLFPFPAKDYSLSLTDWKDGHDRLRRIMIPESHDLKRGGSVHPLREKDYIKQTGLQHTYEQTSFLSLTEACNGLVGTSLAIDEDLTPVDIPKNHGLL